MDLVQVGCQHNWLGMDLRARTTLKLVFHDLGVLFPKLVNRSLLPRIENSLKRPCGWILFLSQSDLASCNPTLTDSTPAPYRLTIP